MINGLKNYPELTRGIVTSVGLGDSDSGLENLSPELQPVLDPWRQPEHALLRGEFFGAVSSTVNAGGAGFRSIAGVGILTGFALLVVELIKVTTTTGFRFSLSSTFPTTNNTGLISVDGRRSQLLPFVREFEQNGAALPAAINSATFWTGSATSYEFSKPIIVPAGWCLSVYPTNDNEAITVGFWARVRRVATAELHP